jgi:hypothetical protein
MKHIYISHAGADSAIADRLAGDLRNAGHETKVDTRELKLGDNVIEFMNRGIAEAHTVIILYSQHTPKADWQKLEIDSAVWNEVAQDGGTCIVVKLDDCIVPPTLGPKIYGEIDDNDPVTYQKLIEDLCRVILSEKTASSFISDAFRSDSSNPFRRVRAEYFEEEPSLLIKLFAPPDAFKMGALEEMKPCFLEGSRGTGKSMLLLSLRARNFLSRPKEKIPPRVFGFYLKLSRGAICNVGILSDETGDIKTLIEKDARQVAQIADIASQEFIVCLAESIFSEIDFCIKSNLLKCDRFVERNLVQAIYSALFIDDTSQPKTIEELLEILADTHRNVANYVRRRFIYGESPTVPVATLDLDGLKRVIKLIKSFLPQLSQSLFVALLDEYENLFPYQQRIVNGYVKFAPPHFSIKIAKKLGSGDTSGTMTGQELQETHDYTRLTLVYDVEDINQFRPYLDLLKHIISNIMRSEGLGKIDASELLPNDASHEIDPDILTSEVAKLSKLSVHDFSALSSKTKKEKMSYYGEAGIYRLLYSKKGPHRKKQFSGFSELAFISSGVIRYFQEILGVAYHLTYGSKRPLPGNISFPPVYQSKAVHLVSEHNLTTLSRNVETYGEGLKYFLLDLGDCLQYKLLKSTSEPEAARLTIIDPESLDKPDMTLLKRLLDVGVREGVFQTKEGRPAFKPKHKSDPQPTEFNICRIYAPVLQISPRLRWRTYVNCKMLAGLASPDKRSHAVQRLKEQIVKFKGDGKQQDIFQKS